MVSKIFQGFMLVGGLDAGVETIFAAIYGFQVHFRQDKQC